jgi:hypothetical protein
MKMNFILLKMKLNFVVAKANLSMCVKHMESNRVATIANLITLTHVNVRDKMGYIEIFRLDENGAGWVDLSEATPDELFNLEVGLLNEGALFTTKEAE